MISKISMSNFRGIKECNIEDLRQINLFVGRNNSGKSSILEALSFAKVPFKPTDELGRFVLDQLLNRRVQRTPPSLEELIFNYKTKDKISLGFSFDTKEPISMEATCNERWIDYSIRCPLQDEIITAVSFRNFLGNRESHLQVLYGERVSESTMEPIAHLQKRVEQEIVPDREPLRKYLVDNMQNFLFLSRIELIDDDFVSSLERVERDFWGRMLGSRTDKDVTSILNDVYGTEIEHFTFKPYHIDRERRREGDRYKLFTALADIALHIDDYGDGFRYAFSILTSALLFRKRALLIEEIESHQHPGSLKKLIENLVKISKTNNLQLFITTHSFDVWRYFYYTYPDNQTRQKEFRSFHVMRDANTAKVDVLQEDNVQRIKEDIFEIEY